jgi:hypothetical protein
VLEEDGSFRDIVVVESRRLKGGTHVVKPPLNRLGIPTTVTVQTIRDSGVSYPRRRDARLMTALCS